MDDTEFERRFGDLVGRTERLGNETDDATREQLAQDWIDLQAEASEGRAEAGLVLRNQLARLIGVERANEAMRKL
jgi:hypothetical protein